MSRLDKDRQLKLEPKRIRETKEVLEELGYKIELQTNTELRFKFKGELIKFHPYSGWHSGKSIVDGRGFANLLKQIRK